MKQKTYFEIEHFKEGDLITRTEMGFEVRTELNDVTLQKEEIEIPRYTDHMGKKMKLIGLFNNQICLEDEYGNLKQLDFRGFYKGWDYYEDIPGFEDKKTKSKNVPPIIEMIEKGVIKIPFPNLDKEVSEDRKTAKKLTKRSKTAKKLMDFFVLLVWLGIIVVDAIGLPVKMFWFALLIMTIYLSLTSQKAFLEVYNLNKILDGIEKRIKKRRDKEAAGDKS